MKNEEVIVLCRNCHTLRSAIFFKKFEEIILFKGIFSKSPNKLNEIIDYYLLKQPDIQQKVKHNRNYISQSKYRIKNNWLKKRFIIEKVFYGMCIGCRITKVNNNLPALNFHHVSSSKKEKMIRWQEIAHLDLKEIENLLERELCVCLCANCQVLIESNRFLRHIDKILEKPKAILIKQEINTIQENISNFSR
ncbi:hypothetical protein LCGC14_1097130 [marine sediment metagenome]|uniref:HNH domain-containing protein n=1 Tax=marine sediment metagenome TaxID=412755 RepID=A0A0F9MYE5_9ZZZZ